MVLKAVIFDFGGVLVRTSDQAGRQEWERRLNLQPGEAETIVFGGSHGRAAQLGQVSDAAHWRWIQDRLALDYAGLMRFRDDFFGHDVLDVDLLAYIARLRSRYVTGLLSNATDCARTLFAEKYAVTPYFDSITISAEEGIMKPDPRIYQIALGRAGVAAPEALFVDDALPNVEGAARLGMQALHFVDPGLALHDLTALTGIA